MRLLRSHGLAVQSLPRLMRGKGVPDIRVLQYAHKLERILLTKDHDFIHDEQFTELIQRSPGVVHFVNPSPDASSREQLVVQFLRGFSERTIAGKILEVTQSTYRYRRPVRR